MKQFYETYKDFPKLSTLLREISWKKMEMTIGKLKQMLPLTMYCQNLGFKEFN